MRTILATVVATLALVSLGKPAEAGGVHFRAGGVHVDVGNPHTSYYGNPYGYYGSNPYAANYYGGRPSFSGYRYSSGYGGYGARHSWHDTSHYDYHPGGFVPHYDHVDYIPGHWDYHQEGHWDHHHH